jgi:hypothetical protein
MLFPGGHTGCGECEARRILTSAPNGSELGVGCTVNKEPEKYTGILFISGYCTGANEIYAAQNGVYLPTFRNKIVVARPLKVNNYVVPTHL